MSFDDSLLGYSLKDASSTSEYDGTPKVVAFRARAHVVASNALHWIQKYNWNVYVAGVY